MIRRGLNEAIAHVKGEEEAGGIRIFVPDETPAKTCAPIEADLKELDCEVYAGRAIAHQCLRLSEAIFIEAPALSHSRSIRCALGSHPIVLLLTRTRPWDHPLRAVGRGVIRSRKRRKSSIVDWAIVNVLNRLQIQRPHRHDRPDGVSVENDLSTVAFSDPSTMDPRFVAIR